MTHRKRSRGILASAVALLSAAALAVSGAVAAQAATLDNVPTKGTVHITKLPQPADLGPAADGLDKGPQTGGIDGVTFEAYKVPGIDLGTNAGQQTAGTLTAASAAALIPGGTTPADTQSTQGGGIATFTDLPRGLYLFKETGTPAGVTPSGDFLVAVPLTDPTNEDAWLSDIYVYPKNAQVAAQKTVDDAATLEVGKNIDWTITTSIPRNPNPNGTDPQFVAPDAYRIDDTLKNSELELVGTPVVKAGDTTLSASTDGGVTGDFVVTPVAGGTAEEPTTTYQILLTADGRAKLATAINADANAEVTVTLTTTVLKSAIINNTANVFPDQKAITNNKPIPTNNAISKYGSYQLVKKSTDSSVADLSGAQFRVYASEDAAKAGGNDYLKPSTNTDGLWTTDASGKVVIDGLRYSNWADNATQIEGADGSKFQRYWLVETKSLDNHQLLTEPVSFTVGDDSATQTAQTITNQKNTGGFVLPLTGGTGTLLLTVFGIAILAAVIIVARRRRAHEEAATK
ncbi:SpaH/EbpB family LPXTG-anchored major pilin [Pseudoclavibacter sp. CFCC 13796]|uniref:SpaH/EbpB family LPXTG-anchored major pilin n=1 Tax=Pseudoclavibacter sp. CFCC 13796 TaxID=2615179 RepID=UPI001788178E|nr:SpaH/EbpB family LPXTG-anchored major pilin [Pseudoclavibacter sp. CFCC 13796]